MDSSENILKVILRSSEEVVKPMNECTRNHTWQLSSYLITWDGCREHENTQTITNPAIFNSVVSENQLLGAKSPEDDTMG